jgi:hypothetical protein
MWTRLVWLRIETGGKLLWIRYWTFGFHKLLGNYRVSKQLGISRVVLSSMELVSFIFIIECLESKPSVWVSQSYVALWVCRAISFPELRKTIIFSVYLTLCVVYIVCSLCNDRLFSAFSEFLIRRNTENPKTSSVYCGIFTGIKVRIK